jgi:hypothetical protein
MYLGKEHKFYQFLKYIKTDFRENQNHTMWYRAFINIRKAIRANQRLQMVEERII